MLLEQMLLEQMLLKQLLALIAFIKEKARSYLITLIVLSFKNQLLY
jgi:hypothetical protein